MNDWKESKKNSQSYLLLVNEECIESLSRVGSDLTCSVSAWLYMLAKPVFRKEFNLRFGIRQAKVKIIQSGNNNDKLYVDETGELLADMYLIETYVRYGYNKARRTRNRM